MATPLEPKSCSRADDELALTMPESPLVAGAGDLELRLLQALSEYAGHAIVCTYATVKHSSRILGFVAASTETAVTKAGLVAIVRFFYNQYMALGHPLVRYVDDAVGRRVVATFVQILLAVEYQQKAGPHGALTANGEPLELTFYERLQALLYGQVPRLQTLIMDLQARGKDIESRPPAPTFNPEDYVPKEEFQRLRQEMFKSLAEKEQEVAELKGRADTAESARDQLEQDMKRAEESRSAESLKLLFEKEHEIALLKKQVAAAERAREEFARALRTAQAKHESERDKVLEEKEAEVATLKQQADAAERASEQLTANLREALTIKDEESRQALAGKEQEVEALKSEIQAAQVAHTKLQEELETTRVRMEAEHKKRVKELEDELVRAKHIAAAKDHEHGGSLREQRASFNATFVKDYVNQSKPEQVEPPKSPARSWGLRSPVRSPARSGNNQIDHDELTRKSTSSARSSSSSAASPRMSEEDKKKEKIERDKLNARVRRVLGSRF